MEIYTIGFTKTTAENFFGRLRAAGIQRLVDVRLKNDSQLAGFAKARDLPFFLRELVGAEYRHEPILAPTGEILDAYKKDNGEWSSYVNDFMALMADRQVERSLDPRDFDVPSVLLCSEATADYCHRRLVVEYLQRCWPNVKPVHL